MGACSQVIGRIEAGRGAYRARNEDEQDKKHEHLEGEVEVRARKGRVDLHKGVVLKGITAAGGDILSSPIQDILLEIVGACARPENEESNRACIS